MLLYQVEDLGVQLVVRLGANENQFALVCLALEELLDANEWHLVSHSSLNAAAQAEHTKIIAKILALVVFTGANTSCSDAEDISVANDTEMMVEESRICFICND